jgi:hypothetical protein
MGMGIDRPGEYPVIGNYISRKLDVGTNLISRETT